MNKKRSKINMEALERMAAEGMTWQEMAEVFGVSRQRVQKAAAARGIRKRREGKVYEQIPYKGLYALFQTDRRMSVSRFAGLVFGRSGNANNEKTRNLLKGREVNLKIKQIRRICRLCGMSFEETFAQREVDKDAG